MELLMVFAAIVFLLGQIAAFFSKRAWVRLIPLALILLLVGLCLGAYSISQGNWAYLIICLLFVYPLLAVLAAWLLFGVLCLLRRIWKKCKV